MGQRVDYRTISPEGCAALRALDLYLKGSGLEPSLLELVKVRVSQINGCAFCLDMHSKLARARGETEQRLYGLEAWREAPYYTERERAALEWTESITRVAEGHVPDEVYEHVRKLLNPKEHVDLTLAVIAINGWNRLAIGFRTPAGTFQLPGTKPQGSAASTG